MKCIIDYCGNQAVCLYCPAHRPARLPPDLERPSAGPDDDTVDLRPPLEIADDDDFDKPVDAGWVVPASGSAKVAATHPRHE